MIKALFAFFIHPLTQVYSEVFLEAMLGTIQFLMVIINFFCLCSPLP